MNEILEDRIKEFVRINYKGYDVNGLVITKISFGVRVTHAGSTPIYISNEILQSIA
jgi:hypothetical protein